LIPKGIGGAGLPRAVTFLLRLAQKAGDFGDDAVPDLRDRTLVERHEHSRRYHIDQDNDEPSGHLITGGFARMFLARISTLVLSFFIELFLLSAVIGIAGYLFEWIPPEDVF
jgi:hypothetical protein